MAEPSSSAAGGFLLWKALGGAATIGAAVAGLCAAAGAAVAMCMMTPRHPKEWAVGITSSLMSSFGGGAYAVLKLGLLDNVPNNPAQGLLVIASIGGVLFTCALPGWALVRAAFTWLAKREGKDLGELLQDARADVAKGIAP